MSRNSFEELIGTLFPLYRVTPLAYIYVSLFYLGRDGGDSSLMLMVNFGFVKFPFYSFADVRWNYQSEVKESQSSQSQTSPLIHEDPKPTLLDEDDTPHSFSMN